MRVEAKVAGLSPVLLERAVGRLLEHEPESGGVLLTGSYARGRAAPSSDLDLMAITPAPRTGYRTWFEPRAGGAPPLHVSAGATSAGEWLAAGREPARWSLGFPALDTAVFLLADAGTRAALGEDPSLRHPAAGPELEDLVDFLLKARRSAVAGDELGLRWFAQAAGALVPTLLIPLNEARVVCDRREALAAALSLPVAPPRLADDLAVCLGLAESSGADVRAAVTRLGAGLLAFLRERAPDVDPQPELARLLADGTLERHLALVE